MCAFGAVGGSVNKLAPDRQRLQSDLRSGVHPARAIASQALNIGAPGAGGNSAAAKIRRHDEQRAAAKASTSRGSLKINR